MVRYALSTLGLAVVLTGAPPVQGQVNIDVSKISCEQFILFKVTDPQKIAIWLSGYHHGKRETTVLDPQSLGEFADRTKEYCRANLKMPVMQAVEALIGSKQ
jgi:acid stress chaperone HdeB